MYKYAKAISDPLTKVFIISYRFNNLLKSESVMLEQFFPNCWYVNLSEERKNNPIRFICRVNDFCNTQEGEKVILVYPSNRLLLELLALIVFRLRRNIRVFLELNERRIFYKDISVFQNQKLGSLLLIGIKYIYTKATMSLGEFLIPFYSGAIIISTNLLAFYERRTSWRKRVSYTLVPILCDPDPGKHKLQHFDGKEFRIGFAGQIRVRKENLDLLIRAIGRASKESKVRIVLNLLGPVVDEKMLLHECTQNGLNGCVNFLGNLSHNEMKQELKKNHLLTIVRGNTAQNRFGFSTKLSDYLELGMPILASEVSDVGLFLRDKVSAFLIKPDDVNALTKKLIEILNIYSQIAPQLCNNALSIARNELNYISFREQLQSLLFRT